MSCRMTSLQIGLLLGASVCCIIFLGHAEAQAFGEQCLEKFKKGRDDFVLDTNESVKDGATFIASMKVERSNDCIRSCCKYTRCNVAFMEKVSDEGMIKSCFLFDCLYKQTYVCRFVRKKGFQNYIIDSVYASDLATNGFPDEEDHPPVANGGPDRVVQPHESLTLNGIESKDDHEIVTYQWHLVSGNSSAVIEKTKFDDQVIVSKLTSGVYKFQLTVTDSSGKSDQTQITVLVLTPEQSEDHCLVPKKVGPCRGSFPRWHYNAASEKCEEFLFGGCRENLNNYLSLQECTNACDGVSVMSSVGSGRSGPLPAPRGTGTIAAAATVGAVLAVAMAPVALGAIGFTAGGIAVGSSAASMMSAAAVVNGGGIAAGGLVAALQSAGAAGLSGVATAAVGGVGAAVTGAMGWVAAGFSGAAAATTAATADHCLVPKKVGPCRGSFPRWHYNAASEKCEEFLFGGCRENLNNYLSLQECTNACDGVSVMPSVGSGRSGPLPAPRGTGTIAAAATVGAVLAVAMAPVVLGVIGFTAGGIAVGSSAASMMSAAAVVNGGGIAAGGLVAALQSAGAAGLSGVATAAVGGVGAAVTGAMEWVAAGAGFSGVAAATTAATAGAAGLSATVTAAVGGVGAAVGGTAGWLASRTRTPEEEEETGAATAAAAGGAAGLSGEATEAVGGVRAAVGGASEGDGGVEERELSGATTAAAEGAAGLSGEATEAVGGVRAAVGGASEGEGGVEERELSGATTAAAEGV
ncbi:kunitz-type protease inhibitor 1-like isoform 2-T2 [Salvelinus alpinus]